MERRTKKRIHMTMKSLFISHATILRGCMIEWWESLLKDYPIESITEVLAQR
jgi:hypothetical protein